MPTRHGFFQWQKNIQIQKKEKVKKMKNKIGNLLQKIGFGVGFFGLCSANIPTLVIMASITASCELVGKFFGGSAWDELFICPEDRTK